MHTVTRTALLSICCALAGAAPAVAAPIVSVGVPSLPAHSGAAVTARPLTDPTRAPRNPFMGANPNNNIHNDPWMTDAYQRSGPLGQDLVTNSGARPPRRPCADR